jgi:adenosylcobinamide amidohydrolase
LGFRKEITHDPRPVPRPADWRPDWRDGYALVDGAMSARRITINVRLPDDTKAYVQRIAKLAGVKPETVIAVLLAADVERTNPVARQEPKGKP